MCHHRLSIDLVEPQSSMSRNSDSHSQIYFSVPYRSFSSGLLEQRGAQLSQQIRRNARVVQRAQVRLQSVIIYKDQSRHLLHRSESTIPNIPSTFVPSFQERRK